MENIRIQDDLYTYVNQKKLEELVIPDDKPVAGGFMELSDSVEKTMMGEFETLAQSKEYPNVHLERACKLYAIAKDADRKAQDGITPALKNLALLDQVNSLDDFSRLYKSLSLAGIPTPLNIGVDTDMKNTKQRLVYIQGASVILPDTTYYGPEMAAQKEQIIGIWTGVAKAVMAQTDLAPEAQEQYVADALAFDEIIAGLAKSREEWSRYVEMYNPMDTDEVAKMLSTIDSEAILKDLFGHVPATVVITEPRYFGDFTKILNADTLQLYKHWAYVTGLLSFCSYLSEQLRDMGGAYMRALMGVAVMQDIDKFAYNLASGMYSEPVGIYYGDKYFGKEAKKDITEIVYQIIDTYKERIKTNEILGEETKAKAILKLSTMGVKMGYPDKVRAIYEKMDFDENASLFDIVMSLKAIRELESYTKLDQPTEPENWAMPGHMVNACYDPFVNDITFPAAILQAPFYSLSQTRSENLGGIGAVIGHEISHAFDSNGAKCDENGNINNWWTDEDFARFDAKVQDMIAQFDGIELPWGKVNGAFIVSENMADNGGMSVTLDIMGRTEGASYEEYFTNWARVWCQKARPEYSQMLLAVDVHGPCILRANMPPRNFSEWYTAFGVTENDQMYIAPEKRIVIW
ncbi:MAG: M13 family metallopeptidase [Clostridia bacterium]|nr:M13 family metallopeptidase [Clostridia bacterium]